MIVETLQNVESTLHSSTNTPLLQILVKEIFHLPEGDKLKAGDRVALYTPANEDFCGTSFVRRNTYLLSGRIVDTILVVVSFLSNFQYFRSLQ